MGTLELLTLGVTIAVAGAGLLVLLLMLKHAPRSAAGDLVGRGEFAEALTAADTDGDAERDELMAAAIAAKHMRELDRAESLLARVVRIDDDDGEAWMERGLVAAYRGDYSLAADHLRSAERRRSDLLESISLHRAWVDLRAGASAAALRRFEEIAAPLESKLKSDLGPGDPLFAEWFFQAADLWRESGATEKAAWARREARRSAPSSELVARFTR